MIPQSCDLPQARNLFEVLAILPDCALTVAGPMVIPLVAAVLIFLIGVARNGNVEDNTPPAALSRRG